MKKAELFKIGAIYTISSIILRCVSFFSVPLFIRLLTTDEFGRYNVFVSYESIVFIFSALTIHASVKNAKFENDICFDKFVQNCIYFDIINTILIFLLANLLFPFYGTILDISVFELNALVLSGFCQAAISIYSSKLVMEYKSKSYLLVSIISVLVGISSSVLFILIVFDNAYTGRVVGAILGQVAATVFVIYQIFAKKIHQFDIKSIFYGLKISLPIVPHGLSQIALGAANRIMIKFYYSASLAGIYSLTVTMSIIPQVLFSSLSQVWEPWFFNKMHERDYNSLRKGSMIFLYLISFVYVCMSCVVPEIIKIFATEEYLIAIDITIIVLCGSYFATLYNIPCEIEYYYKKTSYIAISTFMCGFLNVVLNFLLMPHYSFKVAAYVSLVAYFFYFLFHLIVACRIEKNTFFEVKKGALIIFISVLIMCANLFLINMIWIRFLLLLFTLLIIVYLFKHEVKRLYELLLSKYLVKR